MLFFILQAEGLFSNQLTHHQGPAKFFKTQIFLETNDPLDRGSPTRKCQPLLQTKTIAESNDIRSLCRPGSR